MRVMGMIALGRIVTAIVIVLDAARRFARRRHIATIVIRRVEVALRLVRLTALFRPTLALEATATAAATSTPTATARAAFTVTIATRLTGLGGTVLLQGDLLVDGLLAHGL